MNKYILVVAIAFPSTTFAGGFERDNQSPSYLFSDGRIIALDLRAVNADIEGSVPLGISNQNSANVVKSYTNFAFAYKANINGRLDWSVAYAEPSGANIEYQSSDVLYPYNGTTAKLDTRTLTALLKVKLNDRFSVYGGPRVEEFDADANVIVSIPNTATGEPLTVLNYQVNADTDVATGYVVGTAFEMKDIALRIALTYSSEILHESTVTESATGFVTDAGVPFAIADTKSTVQTTIPQSINLAFQSGINKKTLVFGSVHWAEWSETEIVPTLYSQVTSTTEEPDGVKLVSHDDDTTTLSLGILRKIDKNLSLAFILGYEESTDKISRNLAPTDGYSSITFAGSYSKESTIITAGISLIDVGDTFTDATVGQAEFISNSAIGIGISYAYKF